jgi:hypothetical protein
MAFESYERAWNEPARSSGGQQWGEYACCRQPDFGRGSDISQFGFGSISFYDSQFETRLHVLNTAIQLAFALRQLSHWPMLGNHFWNGFFPNSGNETKPPKDNGGGGAERPPNRGPDKNDTASGASSRDVYRHDFSNGLGGDKNFTYSMDDNKKNRGGSSVKFIETEDGRKVANFRIDRWPDLPKGWEDNPPDHVSDSELDRLKEKRSYRAELTSYQTEDRLKPGHTYDINFKNQLTRWDHDKSAWGDMFFQLHQAPPYGVPDFALGTHQGKYAVWDGHGWKKLDIPDVDQTIGDWHDWSVKMKMPGENGKGGGIDVYRNGKRVYSDDNWQLKSDYYDEGNPYLKFGIYKAVYNRDDKQKYEATGGSRYRELNFDNFVLTDVTK